MSDNKTERGRAGRSRVSVHDECDVAIAAPAHGQATPKFVKEGAATMTRCRATARTSLAFAAISLWTACSNPDSHHTNDGGAPPVAVASDSAAPPLAAPKVSRSREDLVLSPSPGALIVSPLALFAAPLARISIAEEFSMLPQVFAVIAVRYDNAGDPGRREKVQDELTKLGALTRVENALWEIPSRPESMDGFQKLGSALGPILCQRDAVLIYYIQTIYSGQRMLLTKYEAMGAKRC